MSVLLYLHKRLQGLHAWIFAEALKPTPHSLKHHNPPASSSHVLGIKASITTSSLLCPFYRPGIEAQEQVVGDAEAGCRPGGLRSQPFILHSTSLKPQSTSPVVPASA